MCMPICCLCLSVLGGTAPCPALARAPRCLCCPNNLCSNAKLFFIPDFLCVSFWLGPVKIFSFSTSSRQFLLLPQLSTHYLSQPARGFFPRKFGLVHKLFPLESFHACSVPLHSIMSPRLPLQPLQSPRITKGFAPPHFFCCLSRNWTRLTPKQKQGKRLRGAVKVRVWLLAQTSARGVCVRTPARQYPS